MNKYEYFLHDGTHGFVFADGWKLEDVRDRGNDGGKRRIQQYVFRVDGRAIYHIPAVWVENIVKVEKNDEKTIY